MILQVFPSGPFATNGIVVGCEESRSAVVIDPAMSGEEILSFAREEGLEIEEIYLTHSHWDHIIDVALLKHRLQIPVFVHRDDAMNLEQPGSDGLPLIVPYEGVPADGFFDEGDELEVGSLRFRVLHTPGHTPGGVCFYLEGEELLITGDTLFKGSMGNVEFPTANKSAMWESLKRLGTFPGETRVLPGHGKMTTIGAERWLEDPEGYFYS